MAYTVSFAPCRTASLCRRVGRACRTSIPRNRRGSSSPSMALNYRAMATLAQLDMSGTVIQILQGSPGPANLVLGPAVVIDGMNPMPDLGWTTPDNGQTFQAPAASSVVANRAQLLAKLPQALQVNQAFLANASPTQADVVAQVRTLTRQVSALIRVVASQLDSQTGT